MLISVLRIPFILEASIMKKSQGSLHISWQRLTLIALCVVLFIVLVGLISGTAYLQHLIGLVTVQDPSESTFSEDDWATFTEPSVDPTDLTGPSVGHEDITISTLPSTPPAELIVLPTMEDATSWRRDLALRHCAPCAEGSEPRL